MTVAGEATAVPADQFTEAYRANRARLVRYTSVFLDRGQVHLAEDLTQDAFIMLWTDQAAGRVDFDRPDLYGLLKLFARRAVHAHFKAARNNERTADLADPANGPLTSGHSYAADVPHAALLVGELDDAMDRMAQASETWRNLNKESAQHRMRLDPAFREHLGGLSPARREAFEKQVREAEAREEKALEAFRARCLRVGQLRAEIEAVAGPNWRSSTGMPASQGKGAALSFARDSSITHCPKGHLLDRLNTAFTPEGERRCRACCRDKNFRNKPRKTAATASKGTRTTTDPAVIEQARALLADPAAGHTIRSVAELLGIAQMTLYRAFPGGIAAVRGHRLSAPLLAARQLLADPAYLNASVAQIAEQVGSSDTTIYNRLPVAELRRAAEAQAAELAAAR